MSKDLIKRLQAWGDALPLTNEAVARIRELEAQVERLAGGVAPEENRPEGQYRMVGHVSQYDLSRLTPGVLYVATAVLAKPNPAHNTTPLYRRVNHPVAAPEDLPPLPEPLRHVWPENDECCFPCHYTPAGPGGMYGPPRADGQKSFPIFTKVCAKSLGVHAGDG